MAKKTTYTIPKGRHKSRPLSLDSIRPRLKVESRVFEAQFDRSCIYTFKKPDGELHPNQGDFCKTRGNSFCYADNHKNSNMGGWRWNPDTEKMELTSYYHIGGERFIGPKMAPARQRPLSETVAIEIMASVSIEERFKYRLLTDWEKMEFGIGFKRNLHSSAWNDDLQPIPDANVISRDIMWWFGGDFPAPHKMTIQEWKI